MNLYQHKMMDKPSIVRDYCVICGIPAKSKHHIVPRSQGGTKGPVISVCGSGNESGCHGKFHSHRLHIRWNEEAGWWEALLTASAMKDDVAYKQPGWKLLRRH